MNLFLSLMWALSYFALPLFGKRFSYNDPINGIKNEYLVITDMAGIEGRYRTQI